ncbi:MAG: hypothetical protein UR68_C0001G0077 [Candidatus Roizmanbacteria bacterium GW2011_GWA2_35_19]|uniref:Peptidase A2 domain-containing protein n=2 Tax=Candidatus Roizmaniibacteriota TaxID=1752723 RepID=A0A0G0F4Q7_9BACT|nr:MAG: hypothetical protein UR63_C0012G0021 [Candidatus Roizmanbacteria bacterium GW2011_GWC2_35_12]KKP74477.1 MAG: hypothetical protein UR68_C0001G0077 [Candidatus Roizmanbacteria bacterium GW2011_GWA2_35_19]
MIKHRFKYQKYGQFYRPVIPVTLRNGSKVFRYLALIDSGADQNIFHSNLTEILKLDITKLKPYSFTGIKRESSSKGYLGIVELGIGNEFFDAPVIFSDDISDNGYGIVGQFGFFSHFKVKIDYQGKDIELKSFK